LKSAACDIIGLLKGDVFIEFGYRGADQEEVALERSQIGLFLFREMAALDRWPCCLNE